MKSARLWMFLGLTVLALLSAFPRSEGAGGGGDQGKTEANAFSAALSTPKVSPSPEKPPSPLRQHWLALQPNLVKYETQRINLTIMAAQNQATLEGKQPLNVIKQWQRQIANDYLFEVMHGAGPESQKLKQELITRYSYTVVAESVMEKNTPMQIVTIDEKAIACNMAKHLGNGFGEGYCDGNDQQQ